MGDVYTAMMRSGNSALLDDPQLQADQTATQSWQPIAENALRLSTQPDCKIIAQFEQVRVKLLKQAAQRRLQIHAFTSTFPGEGRSTCALHLAISFAQLPGTRVLLIDMDPHSRHKLASHFHGKVTEGFSHFIDNKATALNTITYPTDVQNLHVMPFGKTREVASSSELEPPRLNQLLDRCRDLYDHVVIDAPAVLGPGKGVQVCQHSDETLIAVALHQTPADQLQRAQRMLTDQGCQISGVLLTQQSK